MVLLVKLIMFKFRFSWNYQVVLITVTALWLLVKIPKFHCGPNWNLNTYFGVPQYMKIRFRVAQGDIEMHPVASHALWSILAGISVEIFVDYYLISKPVEQRLVMAFFCCCK